MANEAVRIEKSDEGDVWTVVLSRPEVKNAVDRATAHALAQAFRDFDADPAAKVAVLWGEGGTFCSGADLKAFASGNGNDVNDDGDGPMGPTRMQLSKPVIAAVSGFAVAGGLELAIWCDLRVMEEDATFGVFCRRFGVPLIDGGTVRLPRLIGLSRALDLILTGRAVDASEALSMGLANRVVPAGEARDAAEELAHQIASFPQACMRADRASAFAALGDHSASIADVMKDELQRAAPVLAEALTGAQRFADGEGRHGRF